VKFAEVCVCAKEYSKTYIGCSFFQSKEINLGRRPTHSGLSFPTFVSTVNACCSSVLCFNSQGGVRLSPLNKPATTVPLRGGMRVGRINRNSRKNSPPVTLCPPKILHDVSWYRTLAVAVRNRGLTSRAMSRPVYYVTFASMLRLLKVLFYL
jgi:hypothetical protein